MKNKRLMQMTEKGASLILDDPKSEGQARKQVVDKTLKAFNRLYEYEELEANGQLLKLPQPLTEAAKFEILRGYQTGEIVDVVRCKDCKHWTKAVIGRLRGGHPCGKIHGTTEIKQADDYCSWGERLK